MSDLVSKLLSTFIGEKVEKATEALNESVQSIINDRSVKDKTHILKSTVEEFGDYLADVEDDIEKALRVATTDDETEDGGSETPRRSRRVMADRIDRQPEGQREPRRPSGACAAA